MPASTPTVALMSPGDMGQAVAARLREGGLRVISALEGRSARTRALAAEAGIENAADDDALIEAADMLLSIVAPAEAMALASRLVPSIERAGGGVLYADCNAIAPETSRRIGEMIERAGGRYIDAGIIGPPPRPDSRATRFYASGPDADQLAVLNGFGLDVRVIGERIGDASALKMCYASLTKGTTALMTGASVTASRLGVSAALKDELAISQTALLQRMHQQVPAMVPKAHRWIGEMEEIARTFEAAGVTPDVFEGIADIYRMVRDKPIAAVSPEDWAKARLSYDDVVAALAKLKKTDPA